MPPKSHSPGLKWRGKQPYWVAAQVVRDARGYPTKTIRLLADADPETLAELCRDHTAKLHLWLSDPGRKSDPGSLYDSSVRGLVRLFADHPESPIHEVRANTRAFYGDSLKVISATVGNRAVRNLTVIDVKRWHREWRKPKVDGGRERIKRAHDAVSTFRMILRFADALGFTECGQLDARLANVRFERAGAREEQMTYPQVVVFIRTALELGQQGVLPERRAYAMAIGVAAQFDLLLRQKDVIGEWTADGWKGAFRWDNIPGWRLRLKTSKTRSAVEFDLTRYTLLFPLLQAVPVESRHGAIVKGEHDRPVRERSYRKWYRQVARAAGIPDNIWLMDTRAGGATEADEAGADLKAISDHLTHAETRTTVRYIRRVNKRTSGVADARARARENKPE